MKVCNQLKRVAAAGLWGAVLGFAAAACAGRPPSPPLATLKVHAEPPEARVYLDGRFVGRARNLAQVGKTLPPGTAYMTVEASGYFPHDLALHLVGGETVVTVKLRAVPK